MNEQVNEPSRHSLLPAGPCPQQPTQEGAWKGKFSGSLCPLAQAPFPRGGPPVCSRRGVEPWGNGFQADIIAPEWQPQLCSSSVACVTLKQAISRVLSPFPVPCPRRSLCNRLLPAPEPEDCGGEEHPKPHVGPDTHLLRDRDLWRASQHRRAATQHCGGAV